MNGSRVQPRVARAQAGLGGGRDRDRRPFGAEGPIIATGGVDRLALRPAPPPHRRRAQDPPRRRRRRGHGGHLQRPAAASCSPSSCCSSSGGRAAWCRSPRRCAVAGVAAPAAARLRPDLPGRRARCTSRTSTYLLCVVSGVVSALLAVRGDRPRLRLRGRLPPAAGPLDVVAGHRRPGDRRRRPVRAAGARRGVRRDRRRARRLDRARAGRRHPGGEDADLGALPGLGHLRRRARARLHGRRRARRPRGPRLPRGRARASGR